MIRVLLKNLITSLCGLYPHEKKNFRKVCPLCLELSQTQTNGQTNASQKIPPGEGNYTITRLNRGQLSFHLAVARLKTPLSTESNFQMSLMD